MEPLGSHESPAAYIRRTGLGIDRGWILWNDWMIANGHPGLSRTLFRVRARESEK